MACCCSEIIQCEEGLETLYAYNAANKLSQVTYADGRTVELSYNALRQLTQVRDWLGTTKVEMDNLGRVEKVTDFEGKTVSYGWDAQGRRAQLVYPDGSEVRYGYDALGQLESVRTTEGETRYGYDPLGRIRERELPNGIRTEYGLNALGRLESLTHMRGTEVLDAFRYGYDPAGNITSIDKQRLGVPEDSGLFAYEYDAVNRLTAATRGTERKEYRYDSVGNRIAEALAGQSVTHSYNARNQLIRSEDGEAATDYRYDRRGNLTEVLRGGVLEASYTFGATNMLEKACSAARGEAEYAYDGLRNRVKRLERDVQAGLDPCAEMRYVLDMTRPYDNLLMTEGNGQAERYTWGNELLGAAGEENYFYLQDHLHSPIRLVDGAGRLDDETYAYDEFGVKKVNAAAGKSDNRNADAKMGLNNPFGFTGYQPDDVSGLYYAQNRYYSPQNARMIAEDPICSGLNWYEYCRGNPVKYIDPTGLVCEEETGQFMNPVNKVNPSGMSGSPYDAAKAVAYALFWAFDRNPDFFNVIPKSGTGLGNCAAFVSQCLKAGGIPLNEYKDGKRNPTWFYARNLINWLHTSKYADGYVTINNKNGNIADRYLEEIVGAGNIKPGDVIGVGYSTHKAIEGICDGKHGSYSHVMIVTEVTATEIYYSAHTQDAQNQPLSDYIRDMPTHHSGEGLTIMFIQMK